MKRMVSSAFVQSAHEPCIYVGVTLTRISHGHMMQVWCLYDIFNWNIIAMQGYFNVDSHMWHIIAIMYKMLVS